MAKRHPSLIPVARDHHEGLLLAVRLQQGEQALERLWSHETAWQVRTIVDFFRDHLIRHFAVEEEKVFPLAADKVPAARPIVEELKRHHAWFRTTVTDFKGREVSVTRDELATFGKKLEAHIRMEDRELFPLLEASIGPERLAQLEKEVQEYYPQGVHTRPHTPGSDQ